MLSVIEAAGWSIWPLIICSIVSLTLIIERFLFLSRTAICPPHILNNAIQTCILQLPTATFSEELAKTSLLGKILASGLHYLQTNKKTTCEELHSVMEMTGIEIQQKLEKHLSAIATIASVAPLLGLLGTVIGMIEIFSSQTNPGSTGSNPALLAHGISVALYNTALGLIIAIPSLIFWRYFKTKIEIQSANLEQASERFYQNINRHCLTRSTNNNLSI